MSKFLIMIMSLPLIFVLSLLLLPFILLSHLIPQKQMVEQTYYSSNEDLFYCIAS